jgi:hypothetical protein
LPNQVRTPIVGDAFKRGITEIEQTVAGALTVADDNPIVWPIRERISPDDLVELTRPGARLL